MSDYRLNLGYGNNFIANQQPTHKHAHIECPHCHTKGGYVARVHRSWWQRLLFPARKRYQCMECDEQFWLTDKI